MLVPKTYPLLERCLEVGTRRGITRHWKHSASPLDEAAQDRLEAAIVDAVMHELMEAFDVAKPPGVDGGT